MNKTLAVVIAASVVLVAGGLTATILGQSTEDVKDTGEDVEDSACTYQQNRVIKSSSISEEALSKRCRNEDWNALQAKMAAFN